MSLLWILESGSTKTDMACLKSGRIVYRNTYSGYNAYRDQEELITLQDQIRDSSGYPYPDTIVHYCAGATIDRKPLLYEAWASRFANSDILVYSDIMALAHILGQPGWLAILGTGSNLSSFDGKDVRTEVRSLGWIIGDEGSSRDIAKELIKQYCREQQDKTTMARLRDLLREEPEAAVSRMQDISGLSKAVHLITRHLGDLSQLEGVKRVIHQRIGRFFDLIPLTRMKNSKIMISGGVAWHHQDFISNILEAYKIKQHYIRYPIEGLIDHYGKRNK